MSIPLLCNLCATAIPSLTRYSGNTLFGWDQTTSTCNDGPCLKPRQAVWVDASRLGGVATRRDVVRGGNVAFLISGWAWISRSGPMHENLVSRKRHAERQS